VKFLNARARKNIAESYAAAQKLDSVGMPVVLVEDNGQETHTRLTSLPWTLGHGAWVVKVEGKSGGYDCARIRPAGKAVAA
jgi:protein-disulfide isomerase-like protein with CxxC motif